MTNLVAQRIPAFSHNLFTNVSAPTLTIAANPCGNSLCPLLGNNDPFVNRQATGNSQVFNINPALRVASINNHFEQARQARRMGEPHAAFESYRQARDTLEQSPAEGSAYPIHRLVPEGRELLTEALIGASAFTSEEILGLDSQPGARPALENIEALSRHLKYLEETGAPETDTAATKLLISFNLIQHTSSKNFQHDSQFEKAISIAEEAIESLSNNLERQEESEMHFMGGLLVIECLARRLELAHRSGDPSEIEKFSDRMSFHFQKLYRIHFNMYRHSPAGRKEEFREAFASCGASAAILKFKLGLGAQALSRVRSIVSSSTFSDTGSAQQLKKDPLFEIFFDSGRFKDAGEIANDSISGAFVRRLKAAFANAHSRSILESVLAAGVGMAAGVGSAVFLGAPELGWIAGGSGGALVEGAYQFRNGWRSPHARSAANIRENSPDNKEFAFDVFRFLAKRVVANILCIAPSSALSMGPDFAGTFVNTLANVPDAYINAASTLAQAPDNLFPPLFNGDPAHTAYQLYTKAAGLVFLANLLAPLLGNRAGSELKKYLRLACPFLIPGAIMLSADIGMALAPPEPFADPITAYYDRIVRATIVSGEMLFMLFTTGLSPLKSKNIPSLVKSVMKTDYGLPFAAAIVTGISSPLGGMFQTGQMPEPWPLIAAQGAAITSGLLFLTLGMSGILKQQIPLLRSVSRSMKDLYEARNAPVQEGTEIGAERPSAASALVQYPYEFVRGIGSALNVGYTRNKVGAIGGRDWFVSMFALYFAGGEWDSNTRQLTLSVANGAAGNPYWDSVYAPVSGAELEEDSFINTLGAILHARKNVRQSSQKDKSDPLDLLKDLLEKSGQKLHPLHILLPFKKSRHKAWPVWAFTKPLKPITFPQLPNQLMFGSIHQVLMDKNPGDMSAERVDLLFELVLRDLSDAKSYHLLRSLVKTLLMARNSPHFSAQIRGFFDKNPHVPIVLNIDPEEPGLQPTTSPLRRVTRCQVHGAIKEPLNEYTKRVRRYSEKPKDNTSHLDKLFQFEVGIEREAQAPVPSPDSPPPDTEEVAAVSHIESEKTNTSGNDSK